MIIAWFTQPENSFASYYQFDLKTRKFSRIRLELGRTDKLPDTCVLSMESRAVGFSDSANIRTRYVNKWSVNEEGRLCYEGKALPTTPLEKFTTFDGDPATVGTVQIHRGNPITKTPELPGNIQAKHLALIANDAMLSGETSNLTGPNVEEAELVEILQQRVCEITGAASFEEVTDEIILGKLTEQAGLISAAASETAVDSLDQALATAADENRIINEQIENGLFTPTEAFENAFKGLGDAIINAQGATGNNNLNDALDNLALAQKSLETALTQVDAASAELVRNQLEATGQALETAQTSAAQWEEINEIYRPLETAESVAAYEAEIFSEPEIIP